VLAYNSDIPKPSRQYLEDNYSIQKLVCGWILRNKAYVGVLEYNFRERYGAAEPMTIPGFYPAIIGSSSIGSRENFASAPSIGELLREPHHVLIERTGSL
jgi:hypothetical protein